MAVMNAINLNPTPVLHRNGSMKHLDPNKHAMGTIFEELVRCFDEENNDETGENWTARDTVS